MQHNQLPHACAAQHLCTVDINGRAAAAPAAAGGLSIGSGAGSRVIIWRYRTSCTLRAAVEGRDTGAAVRAGLLLGLGFELRSVRS